MIKMRRFDDTDWQSFEGCETYDDGSQPWIGEITFNIADAHEQGFHSVEGGGVIVMDKNRVEIMMNDESFTSFSRDLVHPGHGESVISILSAKGDVSISNLLYDLEFMIM